MLTDRKTFSEVRDDTLACLLRHPQLFFKYASGAAKELLELIEEINLSDDASVESALLEVNEQLSVLRGVTRFYPQLKNNNTVTLLRSFIGDHADLYASIHATSGFDVLCHTPTEVTKSMPVSVDIFSGSTFSESLEVGRIDDSVPPFMGMGSGYVSGTYVATLLGGSVEPLTEVARGADGSTLREFVNNYSGTPLALYINGSKYTLYDTAEIDDQQEQLLNTTGTSWVARTERVVFENQLGCTGDVFHYTPSNSLYELSEYLRVGDVLANTPHIQVKQILGYRVVLSGPVIVSGSAVFFCKDYSEWTKRTATLEDLVLRSSSTSERISEFQVGLERLRRSITPLSRTGGSPKEGTSFDIKDGHYNVGANHAYNILERGRFNEYTTLTETEASTSKILSTAARVLKAGSLL